MRLLKPVADWWRRTQTPKGRHAAARVRPYLPPAPTSQDTPATETAPIPATRADVREPDRIDPHLYARSRVVGPWYEQWERRTALQLGDGLDDLRADLAPLIHRWVTTQQGGAALAGAAR